MRDRWLELLRDLPVSINNLADPSILRDSTAAKLNTLIQDKHTGPVALITKGDLSSPWWRERLAYWSEHLNLFVFASISHLPKTMEPAPTESRYRTLAAAREAGAFAIAYPRPLIYTYNDSPEVLSEIFHRSVEAGAHAIVSSGFRGDQQVIDSAGLKDVPAPDQQEWMKTLKLTAQKAAEYMVELSDHLNIPYWTRTQCAVSHLLGKKRSLNPYYMAPDFADCQRCPISASCTGTAQFVQPVPGSIELLEHLGFKVEVHTASERYKKCDVKVRSQCSLCCTNCPVAPAQMGVPYVNIRNHKNEVPSWGEMSFARFITGGLLATEPSIPPGENSNVELHPRFLMPGGKNGEGSLYLINSWSVWSEYLSANKCLRCSYCFLSMFEDILPPELSVTVGMSPARILDLEGVFVRG